MGRLQLLRAEQARPSNCEGVVVSGYLCARERAHQIVTSDPVDLGQIDPDIRLVQI